MDGVGDVKFNGDGSVTVFDVSGVECVLLNSDGCVVSESGVVNEDYAWVNLAL